MAFEKIGLGGFLVFDEKQALRAMTRAKKGFADLRAGAAGVGKGIAQVGAGVRNTGLALLPVSVGIGLAINEAAGFEKQMAAVGAITRSSAADMKLLADEAKRQGIVSQFSALESAQAMEFLGRAGFDTKEIIQALGGVMNAAAAEGIGLADSADIIARVVKSMGLEVSEASNVADILALASAKSNTNILALGETFKFGAPQAKAMGISVAETAAVFGKLADAGLRGSIGGTTFSNMLLKLAKPSKEGTRLMKKWNIELNDAAGNLKPIPDIVEAFKKEIDKLPTATEKARVQSELFGQRGSKAFSALALAGGKALADLTRQLERSSEGIGAAGEAAATRLDTFSGALTLLQSSVQGVAIELGEPFLGAFKTFVQDTTGGVNKVILAMQALKDPPDITSTLEELEKFRTTMTESGRTATLMAKGILAGLDVIDGAFLKFEAALEVLGEVLEEEIGEESLAKFTKFATVGLVVAGVAAPLIVGFSVFAFVLKATLIPQIIGAGRAFIGMGQLALGGFGLVKSGALLASGAIGKFLLFIKSATLGQLAFGAAISITSGVMTAWNFVLGITALLLSPIFLTILAIGLAIGLLVGAFLLFRDANETIGETFIRIWSGMKSFLERFAIGAVAIFKVLANAIVSALLAPILLIAPIVSKILGSLGLIGKEGQDTIDRFVKAGKAQTLVFGEAILDIPAKRERAVAKVTPVMEEPEEEPTALTFAQRVEAKIADKILKAQAAGRAEEKADRKKAADKELTANVNVKTKTDLNIRNEMCVDGEAEAVASARHKQTIFERSGATSEPFIRRQARETGTVVPATARI